MYLIEWISVIRTFRLTNGGNVSTLLIPASVSLPRTNLVPTDGRLRNEEDVGVRRMQSSRTTKRSRLGKEVDLKHESV